MGANGTVLMPENDARLVLKITPPRISKTVLERPRLSSLRPEFTDKAVIALQAVSGSGKTSLLAQWRKEALQAGSIVLWLTLDRRDDDNGFVLGLNAAMRANSGRPNFGQTCLRAVELGLTPLEAVTEWLAELTAVASDTLLVLDDVHALPESTVSSALVYLLLNAPANLRIVLSSRKSLALPIFDLPARGRFVALSASDLRFDLSETVSLLKARFGPRIGLDSCVRLHDLTEGWPLGLQLAVSTIERSENLQQAINSFAVGNSDINRYFVECLIDHLPPELAQFLVRVSFVDAVSPALCQAIAQQDDAATMLEQLRQATPIFSEGVRAEWVRMHALAKAFLMERFKQLPEAEQRELYLRAGRWLAEQDLNEEAARHLLEAGRADLAYDLLERCLHDIVISGQVALAIYWVERLPAAEIMRRTSLRLTMGWLLAQSDRHIEAAKLVESIVDDMNAEPGDRCESAEICATAAAFADDIEWTDTVISPWCQTLPTQTLFRHFVGANVMAFLSLYRGAPEQARRSHAQLALDAPVGRYTLGWRDWIVGTSYLWEGQVTLGAQQLSEALARAESDAGRRSPVAVMLASALAAALLDRDQPHEAAALMADRLDILERRAPPEAMVMGYVTAARLAAFTNQEQCALSFLDDLLALGERRHLPRLRIAGLCERIRLHTLRGRKSACAVAERALDEFVSQLADHTGGPLGPFVKLQIGLAHVFATIARQDWKLALSRLDELAPIAERLHRGRDTIQIDLLRALAKKRCGEDGAGLLQEAVGMASMQGLARILVDTHPDLLDWARQLHLVDDGNANVPGRADPAQPGGKAPHMPAAPRSASTRGSLLSPKEREVLRLLANNMSNKQIAIAMGVSSETIKWHVKNLFAKLNAGTRKHLIDRARMAGLLDGLVSG